MVSLETPFSKNSYHIEICRLIYIANQVTCFCMICVFTERYFRTDISLNTLLHGIYPAKIYLFKFNNGNTRTICEICSKITITLNIFHTDLVLMFPLTTMNK